MTFHLKMFEVSISMERTPGGGVLSRSLYCWINNLLEEPWIACLPEAGVEFAVGSGVIFEVVVEVVVTEETIGVDVTEDDGREARMESEVIGLLFAAPESKR